MFWPSLDLPMILIWTGAPAVSNVWGHSPGSQLWNPRLCPWLISANSQGAYTFMVPPTSGSRVHMCRLCLSLSQPRYNTQPFAVLYKKILSLSISGVIHCVEGLGLMGQRCGGVMSHNSRPHKVLVALSPLSLPPLCPWELSFCKVN